jgi:hypothetical protein
MKDKCHSESPLLRFCLPLRLSTQVEAAGEAKRRGRRIWPTETGVHKSACKNNPETIKNQAQTAIKVWILWLHCGAISAIMFL